FSFRSVSEPESEASERGSREGLVEPLRINMTLVRRRIKNPSLKFETMTLGGVSKTDICLCYLTDAVSDSILAKLRKRLNAIDLDTVLASGYLVSYLEDENDYSLFSGVGVTERPDTVSGKINEGRIAILIDGTPSALIIPHLFVESFQTMGDYSYKPYYATLIRWLKYVCFFVASLLPGLYSAVALFNPELFPEQILNKVATSIGSTPFGLVTEILLVLFMYEIMREAGLRLPKTLGHAVSIVGALVIGDTAVSAGLIGAPTLMIVALTAIASYVIPTLYPQMCVLRVLFIFAGGFFGIWGVVLLFCVVVVNICGKSVLGVPYTMPLAPFKLFGMRDVAIRAGWKLLNQRRNLIRDRKE
ncbi:MAG: spore germination protein, partial [Clostridia bacterium]|nr:spore germination protein [Clostridia bacterium]